MPASIFIPHPIYPDRIRLYIDRKKRGNGVIEAGFLVGDVWTPLRVVGRTTTQAVPPDVLRKSQEILIGMQHGAALPAPQRQGRPKTKFGPVKAAKPKAHIVVDGTFEAAANLVMKDLREKLDGEAVIVGKTSKTLQKYSKKINEIKRLVQHFGPMRLKDIDADEAFAYAKGYKNQNGSDPKASTIGNLRTAFRTVMERGVVEKWRKLEGIPSFTTKGRQKDNPRPTVDPADAVRLLNYMSLEWAHKSKRATTRIDRLLCRGFIALAIVTGSRPSTELSELRWRDVESPNPADLFWRITVTGKTDRRETTPDRSFIELTPYLQCLRLLTGGHPDTKVFARPGTDHVPHDNFMRYFKKARTDLGLGKRVTMYSIRHMYATHLLNNRFPIHAVAKIIGTSVRMIELHYGHIMPREYTEQIAGLKQQPVPPPYNPFFDPPQQPTLPARVPEYDWG